MTRKMKEHASGYTVLLVDDNQEYLATTRRLLEREGHTVMFATNGMEALHLLRSHLVNLLLLDYYMPGMTGEEVVTQLRQFNPYVQVILQTGYASEQPPRDLLRRLDIQGYHDKSEGPDNLLMWVDVGLKAAHAIQFLNKSREGLRYILNVTPDLHKIQPLSELLQGILLQISGLWGAVNSFLVACSEDDTRESVIEAEGFLVMLEDDIRLTIRASTGHFTGQSNLHDCLSLEDVEAIRETLKQGKVRIVGNATVVPLLVGRTAIGVIYLDCLAHQEEDLELLLIFANQAAVAIHNAHLYEMAAIDSLTGVYVRRFFEQWLLRESRTAFRSLQPLSLLMLDIDGMKRINDAAGHAAGDQALATMGKVLIQSTRTSDLVARYGGDEFIIVLPQTPAEGAELVGRRILESLKGKSVPGPNSPFALESSIGLTTLEVHTFKEIPHPVPQSYFQLMSRALVQRADEMLYEAKRAGGNRMYGAQALEWLPLNTIEEEMQVNSAE